jgi:NTE family protein
MVAPGSAPLNVGLVLGAGGVLGGAWLVGALEALARETGWDPGSADCIVGTSAGSMIGGLIACGVPPWFMAAHSAGEDLEVDGLGGAHGDRSAGARYGHAPGDPRPRAGLLAAGARLAGPPVPLRARDGRGGLAAARDRVHRAAEGHDPPHRRRRLGAASAPARRRLPLRQWRPRALRRPGAPRGAGRRSRASCAIPGFYHPVTINGHRYVDGGIRSTSNLDLLAGLGLDLVVCLHPMSSLHTASASGLAERLAGALCQQAGRRMQREARRVLAAGTDVVVLQSNVVDLDAMGTNLMSRRRRHDVVETAVRSVTEHLRKSGLSERLQCLPAGQPAAVNRPLRPTRWTAATTSRSAGHTSSQNGSTDTQRASGTHVRSRGLCDGSVINRTRDLAKRCGGAAHSTTSPKCKPAVVVSAQGATDSALPLRATVTMA